MGSNRACHSVVFLWLKGLSSENIKGQSEWGSRRFPCRGADFALGLFPSERTPPGDVGAFMRKQAFRSAPETWEVPRQEETMGGVGVGGAKSRMEARRGRVRTGAEHTVAGAPAGTGCRCQRWNRDLSLYIVEPVPNFQG